MAQGSHAASLAVVIALAGAPGASHAAGPAPAEAPRIGGHFDLVAADGTEVTDRSFPGKWLLIYFGYTLCPDVCPTTLNTMVEALGELGPLAERIQPIFVTVDPQRDTAEVVGQYVKAFDPHLIGLTGTAAQIASVAKEFHVFYERRRLGNAEYTIDHSSYIYVIDPAGRVVELITGNLRGHPVAAELRHLVE